MPDGTKDTKPAPKPITNQIRSDWNLFVKDLRTKGIAGDPALDKNGLGKKYLVNYIAQNPTTSLTPDIVAPIQADLMNYRDYAIKQVKSGKAVYQKGVDENTFMQDLSKEDGYPGSLTTQHIYPSEYLRVMDLQQHTDTTYNKGFATAQPTTATASTNK